MQFKPDIIMGKKGYLNDFEHAMAVVPKRLDLSISEKTDLLGYSHLAISRVYKEWYEKEKKAVSSDSVGKNSLLMAEVRGKWPDWLELIQRQH